MAKDWKELTLEEKIDMLNENIINLRSQVETLAQGHEGLTKDYYRTKSTVDEFERDFAQLKRDSLFPR
jgi:predicted  nucleic acid-binding Zn-ribbon protein